MADKDFKGFKKDSDTYNCYDTTARSGVNSLSSAVGILGSKVSNLESVALGLENDIDHIEESLGTASTKNSTSVVTSSSDLVESWAVKDIVGWGNKNGFDLSNISTGESYFTSSQKGKVINIANPTAGTYKNTAFLVSVKPNTDMHIVSNVSVSSGVARISVSTADNVTEIASSGAITSGAVDLSFNTGNNTVLLIKVYCTTSTSELGNVTYTDMMLMSESETDPTFEPYHGSVEEYIPQVVSDAVGWDVEELYDIDNVEIGTSWNGTSNPNRARCVIPIVGGNTYVFKMDGTNTLDNLYYISSPTIIPSTPAIVSFPQIIPTASTDEYIVLAFSKNNITKADVDKLKLSLKHFTVDEQKADNTVIAPTENGSTTSQAYAVGSHAIRNGKFITWKNAKAQGETINDASDYTNGDVASSLIKEIAFGGTTSSIGTLVVSTSNAMHILSAEVVGCVVDLYKRSEGYGAIIKTPQGELVAETAVSGKCYYIEY